MRENSEFIMKYFVNFFSENRNLDLSEKYLLKDPLRKYCYSKKKNNSPVNAFLGISLKL